MADEPWVCFIAYGDSVLPCRRELSHIFCQVANNNLRAYRMELDEEARIKAKRTESLRKPGLWALLKRGWF
jgi:hypothetical protein